MFPYKASSLPHLALMSISGITFLLYSGLPTSKLQLGDGLHSGQKNVACERHVSHLNREKQTELESAGYVSEWHKTEFKYYSKVLTKNTKYYKHENLGEG